MKYLIIFALVCISIQLSYAAPADKVDCSKLEEVLEDLGSAQGLTALNDKYKVQTTADEHIKRCSEMGDAIKTLRKYNKDCYSSLTQQVFSAVLRTRSQYNELVCKDPESAQFKEAVEAVKCLAEHSLDSAKLAEQKTIATFQALYDANVPDEKLRIRRSCCAVLDSKKFFLEGTKEKCSKHEKVYSDYVDSFTSEAMGLICPEADKLDCGKLEAIKIDGVVPKTKFFLNPMLKLIKTLDH